MDTVTKRLFSVLLLLGLLCVGCVTRTERVPYRPYAPHKDESIVEELRRELGWNSSSEPFYTRAARKVKRTVSGWFHEEEPPASAQDVDEARRRFEQRQREAFRRLNEQQAQERGEE